MKIATEFLWFIQSMFSEGIIMSLIASFMILLIVTIIGAILYGLFVAVDSWFQPMRRGTGKVAKKTFTPAHIQLIQMWNESLKTTIPQPIYHPDDWSVTIEMDGMRDDMSVKHHVYDSLHEGSIVTIDYVSGRISGGFYLKSLYT